MASNIVEFKLRNEQYCKTTEIKAIQKLRTNMFKICRKDKLQLIEVDETHLPFDVYKWEK
jgi:hypothetical protein